MVVVVIVDLFFSQSCGLWRWVVVIELVVLVEATVGFASDEGEREALKKKKKRLFK